jgi:RND family efflux transporter MFP subunit
MKSWLLLVIIVALVIAGVTAWRVNQYFALQRQSKAMAAARKNMAANVEVAPAIYHDLISTFQVTGSVQSPQDVNIATKDVTGHIEVLTVREGDHIKKGQVLVKIDPTVYISQVNTAKGNLAQEDANLAQAQYKYAQAKYTENPTAVTVKTTYQQADAAVNNAESDLTQALNNYQQQVNAAKDSVTDAINRVASAKIAASNAAASITSAQANQHDAELTLERKTDLYQKGYIALQDVDDATAAKQVQDANVIVARGQKDAADAALKSAQAQQREAESQEHITETTGNANIKDARARLAEAQAARESARANGTTGNANDAAVAAYTQSLYALKAAVNAAQASCAAAQATLDSAKTMLSDCVLRSPLDGVVTSRVMDIGGLAAPGQAILTVQFVNSIWVTVSVPDTVSATLVPNVTQASVLFDGIPAPYTGTVVQVNQAADTTGRQFTVRIALENPTDAHTGQPLLKPGMFGTVQLVTSRINHAIAVPREAIQQTDAGAPYVMVADKGIAVQTPVVTGISDTAYTQIISGVIAGDKVVTLTSMPLHDGQRVTSGGKGGGAGGKGKGGAVAGGKPKP